LVVGENRSPQRKEFIVNHYDVLDQVVDIDDEAFYLSVDDLVSDEDADDDTDEDGETFGLDALMGDYGWDDCEV
jgi:hypothetical protein